MRRKGPFSARREQYCAHKWSRGKNKDAWNEKALSRLEEAT